MLVNRKNDMLAVTVRNGFERSPMVWPKKNRFDCCFSSTVMIHFISAYKQSLNAWIYTITYLHCNIQRSNTRIVSVKFHFDHFAFILQLINILIVVLGYQQFFISCDSLPLY